MTGTTGREPLLNFCQRQNKGNINLSWKWSVWMAWVKSNTIVIEQWFESTHYPLPKYTAQSLLKTFKAKENGPDDSSLTIHGADWSQILNDTKESLEKVRRNQCKLTVFQFTSTPSNIPPVPANVVWGLKIHSKPWSLQLLVYEVYFHGNLKMLKSNIQLQRSASLRSCINEVNFSQRGLHKVEMRKITFTKRN